MKIEPRTQSFGTAPFGKSFDSEGQALRLRLEELRAKQDKVQERKRYG